MIDFFSRLYAGIKDKNSFLVKIRFYSLERVLVRTTCNLLLPLYLIITRNNNQYRLSKCNKKEGRVIVSLTSFNKRIGRVWIAIESILRQSCKPDMIILWLSKDEFPVKSKLPKRLLDLQKRGVMIELREGNLLSHKKYYYTLVEYPCDHMITIDDDIIYPSDFVYSLLDGFTQNPDCVISRFAFRMAYGSDNKLYPYVKWKLLLQSTPPSGDVFFGSGGGTFFPAAILGNNVTDIVVAMDKCRFADDVWLNLNCRFNKRRIVLINSLFSLLPIQNIFNSHLVSINIGENLNDIQIEAVREYFLKKYNVDVCKMY